MLEHPDLLPILQPSTWDGREQYLCRPLVPGGGEIAVPFVSYGLASGAPLTYVECDDARARRLGLEEIEAASVSHLRGRPGRAPWRHWRTESTRFLVREGDALTAADILATSTMRRAQRYFRGSHVFVGVPDRCSMILSPFVRVVVDRASEQFLRAADMEREPITDAAFLLRDGRIEAVVSADPDDASTLRVALRYDDIEDLVGVILGDLALFADAPGEAHAAGHRTVLQVDGERIPPTRPFVRLVELALARVRRSAESGDDAELAAVLDGLEVEWLGGEDDDDQELEARLLEGGLDDARPPALPAPEQPDDED